MKKKLAYAFCLALLAAPGASPALADAASDKIEKVLQNQESILQKLEEIKSELAVVKVRASQS